MIIANSLWHYFGGENVGIFSTSKTSQLESLVNKEHDILDEYRYYTKRCEIDLKLLEGQPLKIDVKYSYQSDPKDLKIIALSTYSINLNAYSEYGLKKHKTGVALANRVEIIKFSCYCTLNNNPSITLDEYLKIEEKIPYIIIYCNRILFNKSIKNKAKTTNKSLLKLMSEQENTALDPPIININKNLSK